MDEQSSEYLKIVNWSDIEAVVKHALPHLHEIIAHINPGKNLKLVRARYPFGSKIFHKGTLYLPNGPNSSVPFGHHSLSKEVVNSLNYSCLPLGLHLDKCIEGYKDFGASIHPFVLLEPELSIGTWEYLAGHHLPNKSDASTSNISLTAGARSIFMLPKITDSTCHKRLKKSFAIKAFPPKTYLDHSALFAELINGNHSSEKWYCDVLYFTQDWYERIFNDTHWSTLNSYIIHRSWIQTKAGRITPLIDSIWFDFFQAVIKSGRKINIYLLDTVQRIFYIALGVLPAMTPNSADNRIAPVGNIQKIYIDEYKLKKYYPTVMTPAILDVRLQNPAPVYYSLQMPTVISSSFYNPYSVMDDLVELQELMRLFCRVLDKTDLVIDGIPLCELQKLVNAEYFHTETYSSHGIMPTNAMVNGDPSLIQFDGQADPHRQFSDKSHFVKGCVRISKNMK
jgi:hypothetical protein